jgi:hypothetical protein
VERRGKGINLRQCTTEHEADPIRGLKELSEVIANVAETKDIDLDAKRKFLSALLPLVMTLQPTEDDEEEKPNASLFLVKAALRLRKLNRFKITRQLDSDRFSEFGENLGLSIWKSHAHVVRHQKDLENPPNLEVYSNAFPRPLFQFFYGLLSFFENKKHNIAEKKDVNVTHHPGP